MTCALLSPMPEASAFRRSPSEVMRLSRLGQCHPTRLSFLRILLRRMQAENWQFDRPVFDFNAKGEGRAVYRATGPERTYSLVAFGHDLPDEMRSDRVIATAWDATFVLFDGTPTPKDLDRLEANVPLQEAGRVTQSELTLSRANRSVRLFESVVAALARGTQPDAEDLAATGYLMRTTAVYGSGKFGATAHADLIDRPEVAAPFQAEMLTVWLIRAFTVDLVEHMAKCRNSQAAVPLAPALRRSLGVGNSTGLGMAPFLVRHPILLNNWMMVREEALARVRCQATAHDDAIAGFEQALDAATQNAKDWHSTHDIQVPRLDDLRRALVTIRDHITDRTLWDQPNPWDNLWHWGQLTLPVEGQEALLALLLEPHGTLVDGLGDCLSADEVGTFAIDGAMKASTLTALLIENYTWAFDCTFDNKDDMARFWYVSEDKLEPRLGERFAEPGAERELPLDISRQAAALRDTLSAFDGDAPIAQLLLGHPEHRNIVRRMQATARHPFAEIRDNLIAAGMLPIDMLRCKLAFFGASRFDPRSDRWVRISLFQNCPYPSDLASESGL